MQERPGHSIPTEDPQDEKECTSLVPTFWRELGWSELNADSRFDPLTSRPKSGDAHSVEQSRQRRGS